MGNLLAGAAMRKITPSPEILKKFQDQQDAVRAAGGRAGHPFTGVHEDLYMRVIVVSDGEKKAVLVGADLGSFPNCAATTRRLGEEFGIEPIACIYSATHNHEALNASLAEGGDPKFRTMGQHLEVEDEYSFWMIDQVVEATREAIEKLEPARMGAIRGESFINVCRDLPTPLGGMQMNNFAGNNDHELLVIEFQSIATGKPIGIYINFPCHSNYMVWNVYDQSYPMINNDVGGGISRFVEKAYKNETVAIWAKGAAGDQNPITRSSWRLITVDDNGEFGMEQVVFDYKDNLKQMQALCCTQGLEVLDLIPKIEDWTDEFVFKGADTHRKIPARQSYTSLYGRGGGTPTGPGTPGQQFSSFGVTLKCGELPDPVPFDPPREIDYYFRLVDLCGVSFVNLNSESYCNLGKLVKGLMPTKYTAIQCVTWGGVGYIPDVKGEWINGFGAANTNAWSGQMTEDAYTDGFTELRRDVYGE